MISRPRLPVRRAAAGMAVAFALVAGSVAAPVRASAPTSGDHVLVSFAPSVPEAERQGLVAGAGTGPLEPVGRSSYRLPVAPGAAEQVVARLGGSAPLVRAELDGMVRTAAAPDDSRYAEQWWAANDGSRIDGQYGVPGADVNAESAWATTTGSDEVVVAVVDTGIDADHPDLDANLWRNPSGIGGCPAGTHGFDVIGNDCDPDDGHFHGTHVAGIIGAEGGNGTGVAGVAWNVKLMAVRALDSSGEARESDVVEAVHWAVEAKRAGVNLKVINASWGTETYSQALADEIAWAGENDILVVAAAGNGGDDGAGDDADLAGVYPCAYPIATVVCVANSNSRDELEESSNFGPEHIDLAAPGTGILSTVPTKMSGGYAFSSGTSMAAPMVTGAAALAAARAPLQAPELRARLLAGVDTVPGLAGLVAAGGRLNLCKVLDGCAARRPSNDDFTSAVELGDEGGRRGTTRGSTRQPGEPAHGAGGTDDGSVWFATSAQPGSLRVSGTSLSGMAVAVYTGSGLEGLTLVSGVEAGPGELAVFPVSVPRPERYWLAVSGRAGVPGPYLLRVDSVRPGAEFPAAKAIVPAAVQGLSAAAGERSAVLAWTPPPDGGSSIVGYGIRIYRGGLAQRDVRVEPGQNRYTVADLKDGAVYEFRVWAVNAVGHGPMSAASNRIVPGLAGALASTPVEGTGKTEARSGYWMLDAGGKVYGFGDAVHVGDPAGTIRSPAVDLEANPAGRGYWVVDEEGRVYPFGADLLRRGGVPAGAGRAVSLSATPTGRGYWLFTDRGWAIPFGDAAHFGDMRGAALNAPVLDSIPTTTGRGYYMVAADGGIFAFGDAAFAGSMGGLKLNAPVQSLVPDDDGSGYWLVAADGGVFAFAAPFRGSMGHTALNRPVTGMIRFGNGYMIVAEDGGIFNFSDRPFAGSLGTDPPARPIVAVAAGG